MSIQSTSLVIIGVLAVAGLAGYRYEEKVAKGQIASIQLGDAQAALSAAQQAAAIQKAQDDLSLKDAVSEASAQTRIVTRTQTIVKEVPANVTPVQDARTCVSYGLVRLHDAAALGVDPGTLPLPAGKSPDDCTSLKASDLATGIVGNYGVARQNAEQLDALIADERARAATYATGASGKTPGPSAQFRPSPSEKSPAAKARGLVLHRPSWLKLPHL